MPRPPPFVCAYVVELLPLFLPLNGPFWTGKGSIIQDYPSPQSLVNRAFREKSGLDRLLFSQFFLCNYFTHTFHKDLQDDKLLRRKTEIFPMKVSPSSFQVNFEAVSWNKNRCALWTIFPKIASCDSCDMSQTTLRVQDNTAIQIVVSARK